MTKPDIDAVDEVVATATELGIAAVVCLALAIHESAGLERSVTFPDPDVPGGIGRAFPGGDFRSPRRDGTSGPISFGACQVNADVHGPFRPDGIPDYPAASAKWDNITTSMRYLAVNGPNGGWLKVYERAGGNRAFLEAPVTWLTRTIPLMQGSIPWSTAMAESALSRASEAWIDWLARQPRPEPAPPTPEPAGITVADILNGLTMTADRLHSLAEEALAMEHGARDVIDRARGGVREG